MTVDRALRKEMSFPIESSSTPGFTGISHDVALDGNAGHFEVNDATFITLRVTIHTTGQWPNSLHSDNHVSILLLLGQGNAIQLNMRTIENDRRGRLEWKQVAYDYSASSIKTMDYHLRNPRRVDELYYAIRYEWKLHQYLFSPGGSGCHFWNYCLLKRLAESNLFSLDPSAPGKALEIFRTWYSLTGAERPNEPMQQGRFQDYDEWYEDWYN